MNFSVKSFFRYRIVRKNFLRFFRIYKASYVPETVFRREIEALSASMVYDKLITQDSRRYFDCFMEGGDLARLALTRICYGAEYCDGEQLKKIHFSEEIIKRTNDFIERVQEMVDNPFPQKSALNLILLFLSVMFLILAISDTFDHGFYIFLRFVVCLAFVLPIFERINVWLKAIALLIAVLYNPVSLVHLARDIWFFWNIVTIFLSGLFFRKIYQINTVVSLQND